LHQRHPITIYGEPVNDDGARIKSAKPIQSKELLLRDVIDPFTDVNYERAVHWSGRVRTTNIAAQR
jgi:hypothetical protein